MRRSVSPKVINATTATSPGVNTRSGRELLSSKFFIPYITQMKAKAPRIDFKKRTSSPIIVKVEKSIKKKNGIDRIKLNMPRRQVKPITLS